MKNLLRQLTFVNQTEMAVLFWRTPNLCRKGAQILQPLFSKKLKHQLNRTFPGQQLNFKTSHIVLKVSHIVLKVLEQGF